MDLFLYLMMFSSRQCFVKRTFALQFGPAELKERPILPPDWALTEILNVASTRKMVLNNGLEKMWPI
jgi:hypothetical protein